MIHPHADEIRRLVEGWAAWAGDGRGAFPSSSPIAWDELTAATREAQRSQPYAPIKPIGAEAQLTGETLAAMPARLARALKVYLLTSLTAEMAAREYLRCSRRTYFDLVGAAHDAFWNGYQERRRAAAMHRDAMAAAGRH